MGIKDKKRFAELDALIRAGYGDMRQDDIPDSVMIAAEDGVEIKERGPARDTRWARSIDEVVEFVKRVRPPEKKKKRVITPEQRERINANARARWFYRYGPRDRPGKGNHANLEHSGSNSRDAYSPR
jgi:hypothetical protein